jgi:mono/diheme cytochrome c family protein
MSRTVWLAAWLVWVPGAVSAQGRAPELPPGEGRELVQSVCGTACHDTTPLVMKRDGESGWRQNVERMVVQKGAHIFPGELETLVRYLSTVLGPWTVPMETPGALPPGALGGGAATAREVKLPDGAGRELVQARCTACHDLGRVVTTRRTLQDWDQITRNMIERGPQATQAQVKAIVTYLTTHLGKERN